MRASAQTYRQAYMLSGNHQHIVNKYMPTLPETHTPKLTAGKTRTYLHRNNPSAHTHTPKTQAGADPLICKDTETHTFPRSTHVHKAAQMWTHTYAGKHVSTCFPTQEPSSHRKCSRLRIQSTLTRATAETKLEAGDRLSERHLPTETRAALGSHTVCLPPPHPSCLLLQGLLQEFLLRTG